MKDILKEYLSQLRLRKSKARRRTAAVMLLALFVVSGVLWQLRLTGETLSIGANCGYEEHTHEDVCTAKQLVCTLEEAHVHTPEAGCYTDQSTLICELAEHAHTEECAQTESILSCQEEHAHTDACYTQQPACRAQEHTHIDGCYTTAPVLTCTLPEVHEHTEECYHSVYVCEMEEHTHELSCYANFLADLETAWDWEKTLPKDLSGDWSRDLVSVAKSQVGYTESLANFIPGLGGSREGYSRYGAWFGDAYGDWGTMFAAFCMHYAGIPKEALPYTDDCGTWITKLQELELFVEPSGDNAPDPGDILFLTLEDKTRVAIVTGLSQDPDTRETLVHCILGNLMGAVSEEKLPLASVLGWADLSEALARYQESLEEALSTIPTEWTDVTLPEEWTHPEDWTYPEEWTLPTFPEDWTHPTDPTGETVAETQPEESTGETTAETTAETEAVEETTSSGLFTLSFEGEDFTITVTYGPEAALPETVTLNVREILPGTEEYESYYTQAGEALEGETISQARFFDITFLADGEKLEPAAPVDIQISYRDALEMDPEESYKAIHFADDGIEILDLLAEVFEGFISAFSHRQDSFSVTGWITTKTVDAAEADPTFSVQYYAYLNIGQIGQKTGTNDMKAALIDTRNKGDGTGGKLPRNDASNVEAELWVDPSTGRFALSKELREIFYSREYKFLQHPDLPYFNRLAENDNYTLQEIWILNEGKSPTSTNKADWTVYGNAETAENADVVDMHFTSDPAEANATTLLIEEGTVIRLNYNPVYRHFDNPAMFYDYDITDGKFYSNTGRTTTYATQPKISDKKIVYLKTEHYGINSSGNYKGSGTKLAFGNNNTNMDYRDSTWKDPITGTTVTPNKAVRDGNNKVLRHGCTYGLVSGLDSSGNIIYASGIDAPKLFAEGTATGKTEIPGYTLRFIQNGDTYTMTAVYTESGALAAGNLEKLNEYGANTPSNNFWPMDSVSYWNPSTGHKPGHDAVFGDDAAYSNGTSTVKGAWRRWGSGIWNGMPYSDDGVDHNSYFGMTFAMEFSLTEDYVGPLEYAFFGDDDLWVFLTHPDGRSELICDIGGVHSSMGQYVDLWDYIKKGETGTHRLNVFYTERGASGSTCWINFTLPSVASASINKTTGSLAINKRLQNKNGADMESNAKFTFQVDLLEKEGGAPLDSNRSFTCAITNADGTLDTYRTISAGSRLTLSAGQTATISGLPLGTCYTVTEQERDGYVTSVNGISGYITSGTVDGAELVNFINVAGTEMPSTGGAGTLPYVFCGLLLTAAPLKYGYSRRRRGRRGDE